MFLKTETLAKKMMIGKSIQMSLAEDKSFELWQSFMIDRSTIEYTINSDLYSIQIYDSSIDFNSFNPSTEFKKIAAAEVSSLDLIPNNMEAFILEKGLYAVFTHKGPASEFHKTFQYIFNSWLPSSDYQLDNRPHFELLGDKYKNNASDSEEEVWIPIKSK